MAFTTERKSRGVGIRMKCRRREKDCFALRPGGECDCLANTIFEKRPCPFYKKDPTDYSKTFVLAAFPGRRWKYVKGYGEQYMVSDAGEVKNPKSHILKRQRGASGRPYVNLLYDNKSPARYYLSDLVAEAFLVGSGPYIHIDGDYENCSLMNLKRVRDGVN